MKFTKTLLAAAALTASVGASAAVTGSLGGGFGPFLALNTSSVGTQCAPSSTAVCTLDAIGTISRGTIYQADQPFADIPANTVLGGRFLAAGPTSSDPALLSFTSAVSYISFLWGSPDTYNALTITDSTGATFNFTAGGLGFAQTNGNQSFSQYVQFVASANTTIASLRFTSNGTDAFETANYSITPIPEPETYALMLAGLAALGFVSKRRKQA